MPNFKIGQLLVKTKPYSYCLSNKYRGKRCDNCFAEKELKRCSQCSFLYFCNKICQAEHWNIHKLECKNLLRLKPKVPTDTIMLFARLLLKIKKHGFSDPSVEVFGRKVSFGTLMSHSVEVANNKTRFEQLFVLLQSMKEYIGMNYIPSPNECIEVFGKMLINTFSIWDDESNNIGAGIYLSGSVFDHSCQPNAEVTFNGTELSIRAIEDMPHGDINKVFITYIDLMSTTKDRQDSLSEQYFFTCQCERCISPHYDEVMKKILNSEQDQEELYTKYKEKLSHLKELEKTDIGPGKLYSECLDLLASQEDVLADIHICRTKVLRIAFNACLENKQWADATILADKLIEPMKFYYGEFSSLLGVHYIKLARLQDMQDLCDSARINAFKAEHIIRVSFGTEHPLYKKLVGI